MGDSVFNQPAKAKQLSLDDYMSYVRCVRELKHHKRTPETTKVVWYLVPESLRLKELALEKFGQDLFFIPPQSRVGTSSTQRIG